MSEPYEYDEFDDIGNIGNIINMSQSEATFNMISSMIKEQNKELLKQVAKVTNIPYQDLIDKYLKPDYYLPIVMTHEQPKHARPPG